MATVASITHIGVCSETSFDDAIRVGIGRATSTLRNVQGAWIEDQVIAVTDGGTASIGSSVR